MTATHNHRPRPYGTLLAPDTHPRCPGCDEARARHVAEGSTDHNHRKLPFGRFLPLGHCPGCDKTHREERPHDLEGLAS